MNEKKEEIKDFKSLLMILGIIYILAIVLGLANFLNY